MNELEKDFVGSLKALLKRYNIEVIKSLTFEDGDPEVSWFFANRATSIHDVSIYLTMDDIHNKLINQ